MGTGKHLGRASGGGVGKGREWYTSAMLGDQAIDGGPGQVLGQLTKHSILVRHGAGRVNACAL